MKVLAWSQVHKDLQSIDAKYLLKDEFKGLDFESEKGICKLVNSRKEQIKDFRKQNKEVFNLLINNSETLLVLLQLRIEANLRVKYLGYNIVDMTLKQVIQTNLTNKRKRRLNKAGGVFVLSTSFSNLVCRMLVTEREYEYVVERENVRRKNSSTCRLPKLWKHVDTHYHVFSNETTKFIKECGGMDVQEILKKIKVGQQLTYIGLVYEVEKVEKNSVTVVAKNVKDTELTQPIKLFTNKPIFKAMFGGLFFDGGSYQEEKQEIADGIYKVSKKIGEFSVEDKLLDVKRLLKSEGETGDIQPLMKVSDAEYFTAYFVMSCNHALCTESKDVFDDYFKEYVRPIYDKLGIKIEYEKYITYFEDYVALHKDKKAVPLFINICEMLEELSEIISKE